MNSALDTTTFEEVESEKRSLGVARMALEVRLDARFPLPLVQNAAAGLLLAELAAVVAGPAVDVVDFKAGCAKQAVDDAAIGGRDRGGC